MTETIDLFECNSSLIYNFMVLANDINLQVGSTDHDIAFFIALTDPTLFLL